MIRSTALLLLALLVVTGCASSGAGGGSDDKGYLLVYIDADFGGVLPIKPDSFWGSPVFAELGRDRHYLFEMKPGGYSLGGLTSGVRVLQDTFGSTPFSVEAGKVTYLGKHIFKSIDNKSVNWRVVETLESSLAGLSDAERARIGTMPVTTVPNE